MNPPSPDDDAAFQKRYAHLRKFFNAVDTNDPCEIETIDMNNETTIVRLRCDDESTLEIEVKVTYDDID